MQRKDIIIIAIVIGGLACIVLVWFLYSLPAQEEPQEQSARQPEQLTKEEILEALSVPSDEPPATEERKRQIMEALAEFSNEEPSNEEEKAAVREALQKPAE